MSIGKGFILNTLFTGKNFFRFDELPSTNSYALELLNENPPNGTVILTSDQTAGRGQRGNSWWAQAGQNLTFSVIYYPDFLEAKNIFYLSKITSLALHEALQELLPMQDICIKWPNDILLNNKKVTGILIENQIEGSMLKSCIMGIGLNVNQKNFPAEISDFATSMRFFADNDFQFGDVLKIVLKKLEAWYLKLASGKKNHIDQEYLTHLYGYQQTLPMKTGEKYFEGVVSGVDSSGRLAVEDGNTMRYFDIKEIQFLL